MNNNQIRCPISNRIRFQVFKRDAFRCQYCGKHSEGTVLEVDHIIPHSKGGADHLDNLITACYDCNRGKSDELLWVINAPIAHKQLNLLDVSLVENSPVVSPKLSATNTFNDVLVESDISSMPSFKPKLSYKQVPFLENRLVISIIEAVKLGFHQSAIIRICNSPRQNTLQRIKQLCKYGFLTEQQKKRKYGKKQSKTWRHKYYVLSPTGILWYNNLCQRIISDKIDMGVPSKPHAIKQPVPAQKMFDLQHMIPLAQNSHIGETPCFETRTVISIIENLKLGYHQNAIVRLSGKSKGTIQYTIKKLIKYGFVVPMYENTYGNRKYKYLKLTDKGNSWYDTDIGMQRERLKYSQLLNKTPFITPKNSRP